MLSLLLIPITTLGGISDLPPFKTIIDIGYVLKEQKRIERKVIETIYTRITHQGTGLSIDIKTGEHYSGSGYKVMGASTTNVPQMAVWLEGIDGAYLETLYVTKKASNSSYKESLFGKGTIRRSEALAHWSHSKKDGLAEKSAVNSVTDAITGATPLSSFELRSQTTASAKKVVIKLEVNRLYDYNEIYNSSVYPDDEI